MPYIFVLSTQAVAPSLHDKTIFSIFDEPPSCSDTGDDLKSISGPRRRTTFSIKDDSSDPSFVHRRRGSILSVPSLGEQAEA